METPPQAPPSLVVIGAAGAQARAMLSALARARELGDVLAVDKSWPSSARTEVQNMGATVLEGDVSDSETVIEHAAGAQLVVNLAGPAFALGKDPLRLATSLNADYMDICDDGDTTELLLSMGDEVREAGVVALIGMGSGPGMTNILIKTALDNLVDPDEAEATLLWTVDGHDMTRAAFVHFLHCLATSQEGAAQTPAWDALEPEMVDFAPPIGLQEVVSLGHPEPLTLPRFTAVKKVTNKGGVTPRELLHLYWLLARLHDLGMSIGECLEHNSALTDRILRDHQRIGTALILDVRKDGDGFRFVSASDMKMDHATGLPAAAGVLMMLEKAIEAPGVWAPECLSPALFFEKLGLVSPRGGGMYAEAILNGEPAGRVRIRDLIAATA